MAGGYNIDAFVAVVVVRPEDCFVETIAWLPLTYYIVGELSK